MLRRWDEEHVPRSFEAQLAFAHVCRAWRNAALAGRKWPGVRLSLSSASSMSDGIAYGAGKALLYVHLDSRRPRVPNAMHLSALEQLPRIRTLLVKLEHEYTGGNIPKDVAETHAYTPGPELQDFTFEWWFPGELLQFDFIKSPLPRLQYLTLSGCDLTGCQTILQADNITHINFRSVRVFETSDELIRTFSRLKRLQVLNVHGGALVACDGDGQTAQSEDSVVHLPALKELFISDTDTNIATFLTHVTFPVTATVYLALGGFQTPKSIVTRVKNAIRNHFDSQEGRTLISCSYGFIIDYPFSYEIQFRAPEELPSAYPSKHHYIEPRADVFVRQDNFEEYFLDQTIDDFPALETVSRLDMACRSWFRVVPPARTFRRFVQTSHLVIGWNFQSVVKHIAEDAQLFPRLVCLELVDFNLRDDEEMENEMLSSLQAARDARPSFTNLVLRNCLVKEDGFAEVIFGKGDVQIGVPRDCRPNEDELEEGEEEDGSQIDVGEFGFLQELTAS